MLDCAIRCFAKIQKMEVQHHFKRATAVISSASSCIQPYIGWSVNILLLVLILKTFSIDLTHIKTRNMIHNIVNTDFLLFLLVVELSLSVVAEFLLSSREDDTRSWDNFLVYFSHKLTQISCQPKGLRIHIYKLLASQAYAKTLV